MISIDSELSKDQVITRYLSLGKFLDLVQQKRLYFASLDSFYDQHEGSSTLVNAMYQTGVLAKLVASFANLSPLATDSPKAKARKKIASDKLLNEKKILDTAFGSFTIGSNETYKAVLLGQRKWADISCWHASEDESLAMWQIYGGITECVAITSTVEYLSTSLMPSPNESVFIAPVHYIDHHNDTFKSDHVWAPATHKQRPYSYEQEIRAITWNPENDILETDRSENGRYMSVELTGLIKGLRISPKAPQWFKELIQQSIIGIVDVAVQQSELDQDPIFG